MDPNLIAIINVAALLIFVFLLALAIGKIVYRYLSYKREGLEVPLLLKRDFFFLTGLAIPFLGVFLLRSFSVRATEEPWYPLWLIGSTLLALGGTAYWVYVEYFKIEQ